MSDSYVMSLVNNILGNSKSAPQPVMKDYYSKAATDVYKKKYNTKDSRFEKVNFDDPAALMGVIDVLSLRNAQAFATYEDYNLKIAKNALTDIHGINDYVPKGFTRYEDSDPKD